MKTNSFRGKFKFCGTLFVAAALCLYILTGCGSTPTPVEQLPQQETQIQDEDEKVSAYRDDLVTDAYNENYEYSASRYNRETGQTEEYNRTSSYKIPQINIESGEIQQVNTQLYDKLYPLIEAAISGGQSPVCRGIDYRWYMNGDILSLVVESRYDHDSAAVTYTVCNLSVSNGTLLPDSEVYGEMGCSEEEYLQIARDTMEACFLEPWDMENDVNFQNSYFVDSFNELLQMTVAPENVQQSLPYINGSGQLCIIAQLYSMAGAGRYWHDLDTGAFFDLPSCDEPAGTPAGAEGGIADCYKKELAAHSAASEKYTVYDIDKDGIPELIIKENSISYSIYTVEDGDCKSCGSVFSSYERLYEYEDNGIIVHDGGMGSNHYEYIDLYTLTDGKIVHTGNIMSTESGDSYAEIQKTTDSFTPIVFSSFDDYTLLDEIDTPKTA